MAADVLVVSIPVSPYVEVARWALERLGVPYREEAHAPFLHLPAALRNRGGTAVPVVRAPGVTFADVRPLLEHYGSQGPPERRLYPDDPDAATEVRELVGSFHDGVGVSVRAWAYAHMLPERATTTRLWSTGAPAAERWVVRVAYPLLASWMARALKLTPRTAETALREVEAAFDQVEKLLADGRRYLTGDRFTAADLVFAAVVGPAVLPEGCGGPLPTPDELPPQMREEHSRLREREAAAFALRLYREDRR